MSVDLDVLTTNDSTVPEAPATPPPIMGTCYIFYTVLKKSNEGALLRVLVREDINYSSTNEVSEKIARSMYAIFSKNPVEWATVTASPTLPDLKYLHSQNEIYNLRLALNTLVNKNEENK